MWHVSIMEISSLCRSVVKKSEHLVNLVKDGGFFAQEMFWKIFVP